jgi:hypothetical protein
VKKLWRESIGGRPLGRLLRGGDNIKMDFGLGIFTDRGIMKTRPRHHGDTAQRREINRHAATKKKVK